MYSITKIKYLKEMFPASGWQVMKNDYNVVTKILASRELKYVYCALVDKLRGHVFISLSHYSFVYSTDICLTM